MTVPFEIGVVNGEVSSDIDEGVDFAASVGTSGIELVDFWGKPAWQADDGLLQRARLAVECGGILVSAVGTDAFKRLELPAGAFRSLESIDGWEKHSERFDGGLHAAQVLGATKVRVFSCRRDGMSGAGNPSPRFPDGGPVRHDRLTTVAAILHDVGDRAEAVGITVVVENVRSCWGNTAINTALILSLVNHPNVHMLWDPSNDVVFGGDGYPDVYQSARPWVEHVHIKDARVVDLEAGRTAWECVGQGEVDFIGQFDALIGDGFTGVVSLETHWCPIGQSRVESSRASLAGLCTAIDQIGRRSG